MRALARRRDENVGTRPAFRENLQRSNEDNDLVMATKGVHIETSGDSSKLRDKNRLKM